MDHQQNGASPAFIENFMGSRIVQMAVERGFDRALIHYVVTQHFRETGRQFSTLDELIGSIWEFKGKGQDIDHTLSEEEAMDVDSDCTSPMSSNIPTGKLAGFGIHDEPRKKMSPPSRNESPVTPIRNLSTPRNSTGIIENFMGSRIVQMAVERGFDRAMIRYVVTQHFRETGRQFSTLDELIESILEKAKPIIENFMGSRIVQMAFRMEFDFELIRYVVTQHFMKTGRLFFTLDELIESILEAAHQGVDSTLREGRVMGGQDVASESTSAMSSSMLDSLTGNLAGRSIHDEPSKKMNPPSSTVHVPQIPPSSGTSDETYSDKQLCKICLDNELSTVFLPCKHLATCSDCAAKVTECPMCRRPITGIFTVYMS